MRYLGGLRGEWRCRAAPKERQVLGENNRMEKAVEGVGKEQKREGGGWIGHIGVEVTREKHGGENDLSQAL